MVRPRRGGSQPSWSPGGRFVAFTRRGQVLVVRSTGGPARRLARGTDPVWSPDGKRIAFFRAVRSPETLGDRVTFVHVLSRRTGRTRRVSDEWMAMEGGYPSATAGLDWQPLPRSP